MPAKSGARQKATPGAALAAKRGDRSKKKPEGTVAPKRWPSR